MKKPLGYDNAEVKVIGDFEKLEAGGYILKIVDTVEHTSRSGKQMLKIEFDIAEGDHKDFYKRMYDRLNANNSDAKWKGVHYQMVEGKGMPYFKGLMTAIEESNRGFKWNWDLSSLKGKLFGGVIGLEEYEYDGKRGMTPKIRYTTSTQTIKEGVRIPEDKLLSKPPKEDNLNDIDFHLMAEDDSIPF